MATTPWYTSDKLIAAIKRKIAFPIAQNTFSEEDILAFANEEMMISQVPSVLSYHEEYFVFRDTVPLVGQKRRYSIPSRAIGMRLRDLFWQDTSNNLYEMTRVSPDDQAYWQAPTSNNSVIQKFFVEGNEIVLVPFVSVQNPTGNLVMTYFLRPNQLVKDERAAIIDCFVKTIVVDNTTLVAGDTITVDESILTAVSGSPGANEFQIGATSIITAANLATALVTAGLVDSASTGTPSTATITMCYNDLSTTFETSNESAFTIQDDQGIQFESIPENIENGSVIDFLETEGGHRLKALDVTIPANAISGSIITFDADDVPDSLVVGDYICLANECIIPQIPSDLHTGLADRTCARILAALGDQEGLQAQNAKITEINARETALIDNRVEGAPQKITARSSILRFSKTFYRWF